VAATAGFSVSEAPPVIMPSRNVPPRTGFPPPRDSSGFSGVPGSGAPPLQALSSEPAPITSAPAAPNSSSRRRVKPPSPLRWLGVHNFSDDMANLPYMSMRVELRSRAVQSVAPGASARAMVGCGRVTFPRACWRRWTQARGACLASP
jgi:hypothetical protein